MDFRFVGSHNHMSQFCKPLSLPLWGHTHTHTHTHPLFFLFTWRIAVNTVGLGQVIRVCFLPPFSFLSLSFFFGYAMWHVGSQFPDQGSNPHSQHWKLGVLATGLPGKPQRLHFSRVPSASHMSVMLGVVRLWRTGCLETRVSV